MSDTCPGGHGRPKGHERPPQSALDAIAHGERVYARLPWRADGCDEWCIVTGTVPGWGHALVACSGPWAPLEYVAGPVDEADVCPRCLAAVR